MGKKLISADRVVVDREDVIIALITSDPNVNWAAADVGNVEWTNDQLILHKTDETETDL
jgi:hypothetical protein